MGVAARGETTRSACAPLSRRSPVRALRGVGPARASQLNALGVATCDDLLNWIPFRYADRGPLSAVAALRPDEPATIRGRLSRISRKFGRRPIVRAVVEDDAGGRVDLIWFNAPYRADQLTSGSFVEISGRPQLSDGHLRMINPQCHVCDSADDALPQERYEPVYAAGGGVTSAFFARLVSRELERLVPLAVETLSPSCLRRHGLLPRAEAYMRVHRPASLSEAADARRRLAFDECLLLQLAVGMRRAVVQHMTFAPPMPLTPAISARIQRRLPFAMTAAQARAFNEIAADMALRRPMSRLLMGDVGSGKTIVAVCAALLAVAHGRQVAILAPTTILAAQHHERVAGLLQGSRVRVERFVGGGPAADRRRRLEALAAGEVDVAVGTHALLSETARFARLGLCVVDEQHRFGVWQRAALLGKGATPHALVMSATPIPRTLLMTAFGDLDVSVLDEQPPGRRPVVTERVAPAELDTVWSRAAAALAKGQQVYVVYPVVDGEDDSSLRAATDEARRLQHHMFPKEEVSLLHGRMRGGEKQAAMARFASGDSRVLVCTTVIEVGVDVPAATMMVVQNAERFGLAQLHQLRGRVSRGHDAGVCVLVSDAEGESASARLDVLCRTNDGFVIAEEDLRLRGPGEQMGAKQHGMPAFRAYRPAEDREVLAAARAEANRILGEDSALAAPEHRMLRVELIAAHRERLELLGVG